MVFYSTVFWFLKLFNLFYYFLFLCFCFKNLEILKTLKFFSEYFICHFHYFWPKNVRIIFLPKTIGCSRSFPNFYRFYFWFCVFQFLQFGKMLLTTHFKHFVYIALCCLNSNSSNFLKDYQLVIFYLILWFTF